MGFAQSQPFAVTRQCWTRIGAWLTLSGMPRRNGSARRYPRAWSLSFWVLALMASDIHESRPRPHTSTLRHRRPWEMSDEGTVHGRGVGICRSGLVDAVTRVQEADPEGEAIEDAQIVEDLILARTSSLDPLFREVAASVWSLMKERGLIHELGSSKSPSPGGFVQPSPSDEGFAQPPPPPPGYVVHQVHHPVDDREERKRVAEIDQCKLVLHAKLSDEEYNSYLTEVLFQALRIAKAAGEPGREVSSEEAKALGNFASDSDLDLAPVWQRLSDWRS